MSSVMVRILQKFSPALLTGKVFMLVNVIDLHPHETPHKKADDFVYMTEHSVIIRFLKLDHICSKS